MSQQRMSQELLSLEKEAIAKFSKAFLSIEGLAESGWTIFTPGAPPGVEIPSWYADNEFLIKEINKHGEISLQGLREIFKNQISYKKLAAKVRELDDYGLVITRNIQPNNQKIIRVAGSFRDRNVPVTHPLNTNSFAPKSAQVKTYRKTSVFKILEAYRALKCPEFAQIFSATPLWKKIRDLWKTGKIR